MKAPASPLASLAGIDVLMTASTSAVVEQGLGARFCLHRAWDCPGRDQALSLLARRVRGLAIGVETTVDEPFLRLFPKLEIIATFGVGYDHVDAVAAARRGVMVTNTPGVLDDEVADMCVALVLSTVRELPAAERFLRAGFWRHGQYRLTASLRGKTVGIAGLGRIGRAVARRLEAFDVAIAYTGRSEQAETGYRYVPTLVELAGTVDILISVLPGSADTRGVINATVFEALGPSGIFINIGRGAVVDEQALVHALASRTIFAAGLDVYADEPNVPQALIDLDRVVLLPHIGSSTGYTRDRMGQLVVDNLVSWFSGAGPLTPVAEAACME